MTELNTPISGIKTHMIEPPKKTWFFERTDGTTFACQNNEAWQIRKGGNAYHKFLKMIGCSGGEIFYAAVKTAHKLFNEGKTKEAQEALRQGEKDELEKARGNLEEPSNPEIVTFKYK